jgi:hypothetical protein
VDGYDETAATLSAAWTSVDSPAAWGGTLVRAADAGTARLSFTGFGGAWIGQRDPTLRQGRMLLDGTICPARGETTAVVYSRQLIAGCVTESNASRTVTVSPQPGSAVTVDGFVTLRYAAVPTAPRIASRLR